MWLSFAGHGAKLNGPIDASVGQPVHSTMSSVKRIRPKISLSLDPDVYRRLRAVRDRMPGTPSFSVLVSELLAVSLPMMEHMAKALVEAQREDGTVDELRARDALAKWAGAQLLGLSDTTGVWAETEDEG